MFDPVEQSTARHYAEQASDERQDSMFERLRSKYIEELDMNDVLGRTEETMALTAASAGALFDGTPEVALALLRKAVGKAADDYARREIARQEQHWKEAA